MSVRFWVVTKGRNLTSEILVEQLICVVGGFVNQSKALEVAEGIKNGADYYSIGNSVRIGYYASRVALCELVQR